MSTLRDLVSSVRSSHKLISTDNLATDRFLASEIKHNTFLLVKRELNLRKLWATSTIFTTIPCLEMKEVPISECCNYVDKCNIARSKEKLPRIAEGNYQYVIQGVYSINIMGGKGKKLKEITINRYINLLHLPIIKKEEYFWISNDYLYVTNPFIQKIRLVAFFEEDVPNNILYSDCDSCGSNQVSDEEWCKNPLDREFALPGYLEKQVLELTSKKLLETYFKIPTDVNLNGIDNQASNSVEKGK
jgi:hypothetical protein